MLGTGFEADCVQTAVLPCVQKGGPAVKPDLWGHWGNVTAAQLNEMTDAEHPDGRIARWGVRMIANFSRAHAARGGDVAPFFLGVGLHKPHLPWYVPQRYYDMYTLSELPLPPNPFVPINLPFEAFDPSEFDSTVWRCCLYG